VRPLIEEAWDEFSLGEDPPPFSPDTVHMPVFILWFLYEWLADPAATAVPADLLDQFPIAAAPGTGFRLHDNESDREDEEPSTATPAAVTRAATNPPRGTTRRGAPDGPGAPEAWEN
jgi:hypothetical protein